MCPFHLYPSLPPLLPHHDSSALGHRRQVQRHSLSLQPLFTPISLHTSTQVASPSPETVILMTVISQPLSHDTFCSYVNFWDTTFERFLHVILFLFIQIFDI